MTPRGAAIGALVLLGVALVVSFWVLIPWGAARDATGSVTPDAGLDFTAAEMAVGDRLARLLLVPGLTSLGVGLALTVALGLTPWGARLVDAVARPLGGGWFWQVTVGGLVLLLVVRLVTLPFGAWAESVRRDEGLSTRTWASWLLDVAKGFGISAVLTLLALAALVGLARRWPDWWWAAGAAGAAVLVVVVSFAYPLVVEPLFNKFTPMPDGELRTSLMALAERDGVPVDDVLVADASRRTTTLNAYVSGLRQQPPDRRLRHAARPGACVRGRVGGRARARPRQGEGRAGVAPRSEHWVRRSRSCCCSWWPAGSRSSV